MILPRGTAAQVDKGHLVSSLLFFSPPFCALSEAKRRAELPEGAFNHKLKVLFGNLKGAPQHPSHGPAGGGRGVAGAGEGDL